MGTALNACAGLARCSQLEAAGIATDADMLPGMSEVSIAQGVMVFDERVRLASPAAHVDRRVTSRHDRGWGRATVGRRCRDQRDLPFEAGGHSNLVEADQVEMRSRGCWRQEREDLRREGERPGIR